ncbi:MAG TPA: hypothetical protein VMT35_02710, partial [Ignavibacteriaceae bacterium]|nr:hypothetical protein [Ignavibacteriaceae bacterium]
LSHLLKKYFSFYRLFYVLFSLALLIWLIKYTNQFDDKVVIITYSYPWFIIRNILMYGSLLIFFWAFFFNYDSLSFFGIRQIMNFRKEIRINPNEAIKRNGLLGIIRHPMYLTLIIFLWSTIFTFMDLYINSLLTIYVIIGTYLEEKKLVREFGNAYVKYQHEVRMLVPFIKLKVVKS